MKLIVTISLNVLTLMIVSYLVPGFRFDSLWATIVTAIVIGVTNTFIKPILKIIFLPRTIITLGVSSFLINVVLLWAVSFIEIEGFLTAVIASIVLSLVSTFLHKLAEEKG